MDTASFATTPVAVLAGYHEVAPTLSYDGAQIAYDRYQVGGNPDVVAGLYTVGFDGSNPMPRAAYGGDRNPSWAPDGSKIAYELSGSIMTVDTDAAGIKTTLTTGGFDANPSWSVALPQVTVSVSPLSVDLADVEVGSSGAATFTITSTGTATLTISDIASDDAAFTVASNTGTPPFDLTSGESETVTVTFTPTVEGAQTASVTITHNAAGSPSVVTATGTGTALSGPPPDAVTVIDAQGALASLVSIPIEIYDVTGLGVVGVAMSLTYRSDILTPTSTAGDTTAVMVDSGVVPASWTLEQNTELIDATTSQLNFSMAGDFADPLAGPGTLVDIAFDVTATAPGDPLGTTYPIQLTNVQLNEGMASSTPVHGSFIVLEFVYGDVTGNGAAGAYDAAWVLEHVANAMLAPPVEVPFPIEETAPVWASLPLSHADAHDVADVDGDGDITALDASLILQKEVSRIDVFPVEAPPAAPIVDAGGLPYRLLSGAESARPGGTITVSLDASETAELYSGELRLDFDGSLLTPVDVSLRSASSGSDMSIPLLLHREGDGQVAIVFASARPIESSHALLEVTFEASRAITEPTEGTIRATHLRLNRSLIDTGFVYRYRVEPYRNQLLANYPNPFNPETWIPFELAADADVTIRIYDLAGGRIRTLELGALATGEYVGRERAAYWDGKNAQGERVASGVYVYELAAGGYRSLRRMVVMK